MSRPLGARDEASEHGFVLDPNRAVKLLGIGLAHTTGVGRPPRTAIPSAPEREKALSDSHPSLVDACER